MLVKFSPVIPNSALVKEYITIMRMGIYTRQRVLWASKEHSSYASSEFVKIIVNKFKYPIECIQTDNGTEFTNRLNVNKKDRKTMFEKKLKELNIMYKNIEPYTPKQNGKVERSHRKDQERFYYGRKFYSLEDLRNQGRHWLKEYNNFPMKPLKWLSPREYLKQYKSQGQTC